MSSEYRVKGIKSNLTYDSTNSTTTTNVPTSFKALKSKFLSNLIPTSTSSTTPPNEQQQQQQNSLTTSSLNPLNSLISKLNSHPDHFTTSSCSGRIVIYAASDDEDPNLIQSLPFTNGTSTTFNNSNNLNSKNNNFIQQQQQDEEDSEEEEELEGKGHARSKLQNGKSGGIYLFESNESVQIPSEEYELMSLIFGKDVPILSYEDEAPLNDLEDYEESQSSIGLKGIVSFKFEAMVLHLTSSSPTASLPFLRAALKTGHQGSGLILPNSALSSLLNPIPTPTESESLSAKCRSNLAIRTTTMNLDCPIARRILLPILPSPTIKTSPIFNANGPSNLPFTPPLESTLSSSFNIHNSNPTNPNSTTSPKITRSPSSTNSTSSLEFEPGYKLLVPPSYLYFLLRQANLRMETNLKRIKELESSLTKILSTGERNEEWKENYLELERVRKSRYGINDLMDDHAGVEVERTVGGVRDWLSNIT